MNVPGLIFYLIAICCVSFCTWAQSEGDTVLVVYNRNLPESKKLAEYYAQKRNVPAVNLVGLDLPKTDTITRGDYRDEIEEPLIRKLEKDKLWVYPRSSTGKRGDASILLPVEAKIRYAVLCYGVPFRILSQSRLKEKEEETLPVELRRNEAAVDSELALLPRSREGYMLSGLIPNTSYAATNVASIHPTNGVLIVTRLDGPSFGVARSLVDRAIEAEAFGLWGRAYFDARGLTNGDVKIGDDWIKGAAEVTRRLGYETVIDDTDERFRPSFPLSHVAFYAGWYEYNGQLSGPFTMPTVEFMPGAVAYHLHSFSAQNLRSATHGWVGPLLAKGATASLGCVHEPYLAFTPNIAMLFHRFIHAGFSFGEAAYSCQMYLSWQTTIVGDPLYRPFARKPQEMHEMLEKSKDKRMEWSHLKVVNINIATGVPATNLIQYLEQVSATAESAILSEELGDLYSAESKFAEASTNYQHALELSTSHQQKVRLKFAVARTQELSGQLDKAFETLKGFFKAFPEYPEPVAIYYHLTYLASRLGKEEEKVRFQREVERLEGRSPNVK